MTHLAITDMDATEEAMITTMEIVMEDTTMDTDMDMTATTDTKLLIKIYLLN